MQVVKDLNILSHSKIAGFIFNIQHPELNPEFAFSSYPWMNFTSTSYSGLVFEISCFCIALATLGIEVTEVKYTSILRHECYSGHVRFIYNG